MPYCAASYKEQQAVSDVESLRPIRVAENVEAYSRVQQELTFHNDLLYRGVRMVIPKPLRSNLLAGLHSTHLGIFKMKSLVRGRYWWPRVDADIEQLCKSCTACLSVNNCS